MHCKLHQKKRPKDVFFDTAPPGELAAGEGFEPSQTESESVVLPLHHPAVWCFNYNKFVFEVNIFPLKSHKLNLVFQGGA